MLRPLAPIGVIIALASALLVAVSLGEGHPGFTETAAMAGLFGFVLIAIGVLPDAIAIAYRKFIKVADVGGESE